MLSTVSCQQGKLKWIGHPQPQPKIWWNNFILQALQNCKKSHRALISHVPPGWGWKKPLALVEISWTSFGPGIRLTWYYMRMILTSCYRFSTIVITKVFCHLYYSEHVSFLHFCIFCYTESIQGQIHLWLYLKKCLTENSPQVHCIRETSFIFEMAFR